MTAAIASAGVRLRPSAWTVGLVVLLVAVVFAGACVGTTWLSPREVLRTLSGGGSPIQETLLFHLRLPRLVLAAIVGAGFALSGGILQCVVRNVLADPGLLGINAGAGLAAATYVGFQAVQSDQVGLRNSVPHVLGLPCAALAGGALTAVAVYALARRRGVTPWRLVLVGIAVGQGLAAVTMVVLTRLTIADLAYAKIWLVGSIWGANWTFVLVTLPWVVVLGGYAVARARVLDVLALGDAPATALGVPVERERRLLLGAATGLAAACVAVGGGIGFLGLFAPHIARRLVGAGHRALLPVAALVGAVTLVIADRVGHGLLAPHEVPAGAVVAAVGAPYFLYLLARTRG